MNISHNQKSFTAQTNNKMCRTSNNTYKTYNLLTADSSQVHDGRSLTLVENIVHHRTHSQNNCQRHAYKTYNLLTADLSQVYDGRHLTTQLKNIVHHRTPSTSNHQQGQQDVQDASQLSVESALSSFKGYCPVRQKQSREQKDKCSNDDATVDTLSIASTKSTNFSRRSSSGSSLPNTTRNHRLQRRHSFPETTSPESIDILRSQVRARPGQVLVRQKYTPRHRNTSLNQSVRGIMQPSQYSHTSSGTDCPQEDSLLVLSTDLTFPSRDDDDDSIFSSTRTSTLSRRRSLSNSSFHSLSTNLSKDSWVPIGVDFFPNVEVQVDETPHHTVYDPSVSLDKSQQRPWRKKAKDTTAVGGPAVHVMKLMADANGMSRRPQAQNSAFWRNAYSVLNSSEIEELRELIDSTTD